MLSTTLQCHTACRSSGSRYVNFANVGVFCADVLMILLQYTRIASLEELIKKLSAKDEKKEKEESEAPIFMGTGRLMIGNGPVNGMGGPPMPMPMQMQMPMQTGMPGFY